MTEEDSAKRRRAPRPAPADGAVIPVETLLAERREVVLVHQGERYVLRITAKGKLILTK